MELFRTNRFVGVDRIGDANQVSAAVTSRLLDTGSGQQFLSATLGQTYYFQAPRVQIPLEPTTGLRSDVVAEVALTAYKTLERDAGRAVGSAGRQQRSHHRGAAVQTGR